MIGLVRMRRGRPRFGAASTGWLLAVVALGILMLAAWAMLERVRNRADALATRDFQRQQALLASSAAERLGMLLRDVRWRLERLRPPDDPIDDPGKWLESEDLERRGAVLFVHDARGRVLALPPDLDPTLRRSLGSHEHRPPDGVWTEGSDEACPVCLSEGGRLSLSRALPGHEELFVSAAIDVHGMYESLFAPLSGPHDSYIWVLAEDGTIVAAPEHEMIGTRPLEGLEARSAETLGPLVERMTRGDRRFTRRQKPPCCC